MSGVAFYSYAARVIGTPLMASGMFIADDDDKARRFRELALPHLDAVYTLARYLMGNATEAEDAAQECYLRAFRHFDSYRGQAIKPWLMAILRNVCRAAYQKNAGLVCRSDSSAGVDDAAIPVWNEDCETPETAVLRRHDTETMRKLIGDLPADFREVIVLREINDLSYRDIAVIADIPIGTVMSRLARARAMLRAAWQSTEGEGKPQ